MPLPHDTPQVSVIIVNYRTRAHLEKCLPALAACMLSIEVIIVDNDGSAAGLDTAYPTVRVLPQPENSWFCGGNNIGIAAARGQYVLLLNPDTIPQPGALESLVTFMNAHPDYRGATVQLRYPDGRIQRTCSRIPTYSALLLNHTPLGVLLSGWRRRVNAHQWYEDWTRDSARDVEVLPGSCLLMRRADVWLNTDLRLYFPEDDLAQRYHGQKFRFLADSCILHDEKSVTQSWQATQIYFRDLLRYTRQHHGGLAWALLTLLSRPLLWGMALRRYVTTNTSTVRG